MLSLCPSAISCFVGLFISLIVALVKLNLLQEKRLVAQVNAVAVLDMIKDLQDEIKVTDNQYFWLLQNNL